jgi:hypothetical protein
MIFELTPNQKSLVTEWETKHTVHCPIKNKKILARYTICFAAGDDEHSVYVECKCGAKHIVDDI